MLKVFLVEDESVIREGLRDKIPWEQYGYTFVGEAADGEMALPLIRKTRPDVLITDIKMPFMDGLSLSKIVNAELPRTKIIIISGYDDFEYARQAIQAGVEQYLLKPITKLTLRKTLLEMKEKIQQDKEQKDYQAQFQNDLHVYEQFSRRRFMEKLLEGELSVQEIYQGAAKLGLQLSASSYNLLFLYLQEKDKERMEQFLQRQDQVLHYFLRHPQYILFRWNVNCYGVLIKGEKSQMEELSQRGLAHIRQVCTGEEQLEWYAALGKPVERLSMLPQCYQGVNHYFAYRFIVPGIQVLTEDTLAEYLTAQEDRGIKGVDTAKMNPELIRDFLEKGSVSEICDFVESYLQSIGEALESRMFRDYVVLHIRFTAIAYLESIGVSQEEYIKRLGDKDVCRKAAEIPDYFAFMLKTAMDIREENSSYQSGKLLRRAQEYIDENYDREELSLNNVAAEVNVSANYLSAVFSQTMQKTFVEYVTGKRMEKARKLLRTTDCSSSEIAAQVGYKDPRYFSFVFKKTQGVSPREYRNGKRS